MQESVIRTTTKLAMTIVGNYVREGDVAVDATAGNGHDTLALLRLVGGSGKVYAFDIQRQAIERTNKLLTESAPFLLANVSLVCDSHENLSAYVEEKGRISAVVFNLGYLPSGDKSINTKAESTVSAMEESLKMLKKGGLLSVVMYPGTDTGKIERDAVLSYVQTLPVKNYHVCRCDMPNSPGVSPEILWIETK